MIYLSVLFKAFDSVILLDKSYNALHCHILIVSSSSLLKILNYEHNNFLHCSHYLISSYFSSYFDLYHLCSVFTYRWDVITTYSSSFYTSPLFHLFLLLFSPFFFLFFFIFLLEFTSIVYKTLISELFNFYLHLSSSSSSYVQFLPYQGCYFFLLIIIIYYL